MGIFHGSRDKSFVIKRPTSDKWPVHMGGIFVHGDYDNRHHDYCGKAMENLFFGKLVSWETCVFQRGKENFFRAKWNNGIDTLSCWDWLRTHARECGTVWLWGWRIWPAWCLLDGRTEISEQRLILDIRNGEDKVPGKQSFARRSSGLFVAENPPTIICLAVPGGGRIKIIDLANYGIEPEDFGVDGQAGALAATVHAVKEYARFCKKYNLGSCQTTAASQAWYCFRRSHMHHQVTVNPIKKVLDLEQAAYYGGRCECARIGRFSEKLYHLDVNSMYTTLSLIGTFPVRHCSTWTEEMGTRPPAPSHMKGAIADVTIETFMPCFPAREGVKVNPFDPPGRKSGRERIIYPVGKFRTALAGVELGLAVDSKVIRKWHRIQYYDLEPLMNGWAQWALNMRHSLCMHGFTNLARCAKKIMNSLPGKWGQRVKKWVDVEEQTGKKGKQLEVSDWYQEWGLHPGNQELTPYRTVAGQTQYQDREELSAVSCPSIAGYWTALGRVFLWGGIIQCGQENVYYYDTDSVIVNQIGYDRIKELGLLCDYGPGKWKLKESSDDVEILGIRRYRFGPRWCVAGPFGGVVSGGGDPGKFIEHESFSAQLWHHSACDPVEIKRHAKWRKEYHHGMVQDDGKVEAFFVGDILSRVDKALE